MIRHATKPHLDLNTVEALAVVDTDDGADHLGDDGHVAKVGLDAAGLLANGADLGRSTRGNTFINRKRGNTFTNRNQHHETKSARLDNIKSHVTENGPRFEQQQSTKCNRQGPSASQKVYSVNLEHSSHTKCRRRQMIHLFAPLPKPAVLHIQLAYLLGLVQPLDQGHVLALKATVEAAADTRANKGHEVLVLHVQELIEINPPVVELPEGPLLLDIRVVLQTHTFTVSKNVDAHHRRCRITIACRYYPGLAHDLEVFSILSAKAHDAMRINLQPLANPSMLVLLISVML